MPILVLNIVHLTQSSQRYPADRDLIDMILGLSNTNQQPGTGSRNYVLGSRRRSNWNRTPPEGRRSSRYILIILINNMNINTKNV